MLEHSAFLSAVFIYTSAVSVPCAVPMWGGRGGSGKPSLLMLRVLPGGHLLSCCPDVGLVTEVTARLDTLSCTVMYKKVIALKENHEFSSKLENNHYLI